MRRTCTHCHRPFTRHDFVKHASRNMEADRKALGLEGVRFLYYTCSQCGRTDIFLDVHHRFGESDQEFQHREADLEAAIRRVQPKDVDIVLVERP